MVLALRLSLCIRSCLFCISLSLKYFFVAVVLCPPSASPFFTQSLCSVRPQTTCMPLFCEEQEVNFCSPFISSVALENPEFSLYPRAKCSMDYAQKVFLHAGDALFIPEGCLVSASAVKLSQFGDFVFSNMLYWIAKSMYKFKIDRQRNGQNRALPKASPGSEKLKRHTCERLRNVGGGTKSIKAFMVHLMINLLQWVIFSSS
ncbi:hypothetical protein NC651_005211 [Populus alba x Populus x berolinensis]|nr:hypothetical protein NC651_005211 [Populus alba x Populus x berolinensis]